MEKDIIVMNEIEVTAWGFLPSDFTGKARYIKDGSLILEAYLKDGELHCEFGPATLGGYYLNGDRYSRDDWFNKLTKEQKVKALMNPENFYEEP